MIGSARAVGASFRRTVLWLIDIPVPSIAWRIRVLAYLHARACTVGPLLWTSSASDSVVEFTGNSMPRYGIFPLSHVFPAAMTENLRPVPPLLPPTPHPTTPLGERHLPWVQIHYTYYRLVFWLIRASKWCGLVWNVISKCYRREASASQGEAEGSMGRGTDILH